MLNKSLSNSSDFLKGLAMIALVYFHYIRLEYGIIDNIEWIWNQQAYIRMFAEAAEYDWPSVMLRYFGHIGVSVFFILSSWGLTYSLLQKRAEPAGWLDFMHARIRKLAPFYWIALFILFVSAIAEHHESSVKLAKIVVSFALKASFLHIFHPLAMFNYNSALWFFGTLVFLYMCFPALFKAVRARPNITLVASILAGYLFTLMIKATPLYAWHPALAMGGFPLTRLGDFTFGIFLAMHSQQCEARGVRDVFDRWGYLIAAAALGLGLLGYACEWLHPFHQLGLGVFVILAGTKLYDVMSGYPRIFGTALAAVSFVGTYSYAMFLFHVPLIRPWLAWVSDRQHVFLFGTLFLVTMVFVFYGIEKFSNRYLVPPIQTSFDAVFRGIFKRSRC